MSDVWLERLREYQAETVPDEIILNGVTYWVGIIAESPEDGLFWDEEEWDLRFGEFA